MGRKKFKINRNAKIIILLCVFFITPVALYLHFNGYLIDVQLNTLRTPFNVNYLGFDVHDGITNEYITSVSPGNQFTDPTFTYPKIDVFKSDPFFVDSSGDYVATCPEEYLDPYGVLAINGSVYYAHELRYGFDWGVRTTGNMPPVGSYPADLSPLWGYTLPGGHEFVLDDPDNPAMSARGVLTGYVSRSLTALTPNFVSGAQITCSLEPIDIRIGNNPTDATQTYDTAIQSLKTGYGNSKVSVYPRLSLDALPSFFTTAYDFEAPLAGENLTFSVKPGQASIGISGADKSWEHDDMGIIPNALTEQLQSEGYQMSIPSANNIVNRDKDYETDESDETSSFYTTSEILSGSVEYLGPEPDEVVTGFADPHGSIEVNATIPAYEFVFDENANTLINNYPRSVQLKMGNTLQPLTTISIAKFRVSWEFGFINLLTQAKSYERNDQDILIPCGIREENMYTVQRIIVKSIVLTQCSITAVGPTGEPVDISQLTDFQLNQIIKNPERDIFEREVNLTTLNPDAFATIIWIVVAIVVFVSIVGIYVFLKVLIGRYGGGGGNSGPKQSYEFKLGAFHIKRGGSK